MLDLIEHFGFENIEVSSSSNNSGPIQPIRPETVLYNNDIRDFTTCEDIHWLWYSKLTYKDCTYVLNNLNNSKFHADYIRFRFPEPVCLKQLKLVSRNDITKQNYNPTIWKVIGHNDCKKFDEIFSFDNTTWPSNDTFIFDNNEKYHNYIDIAISKGTHSRFSIERVYFHGNIITNDAVQKSELHNITNNLKELHNITKNLKEIYEKLMELSSELFSTTTHIENSFSEILHTYNQKNNKSQ